MMKINYINLLNNIILSLKSSPINSLEVLSNESYLYSLIKEILPNFTYNDNLYDDKNTNDFISLLTSIEKYSNESRIKEYFTKETAFSKTISIKDLINNDSNELIKLAEMLIFLTMLSSNKNYYIEKINQIDDNKLNKLYYDIIEKYISFKIDESRIKINKKQKKEEKEEKEELNIKPFIITQNNFNILVTDMTHMTQLDSNEKEKEKKINNDLIIQNEINFYINKIETTSDIYKDKDKDSEMIINELKEENEELNNIINNLSLAKKELESINKNNSTKIKELELDYEKLKEEYELKEQNTAEMISNNKSMIEKLNHDLKLAIKENQKSNEDKEQLIKELNKYKENNETKKSKEKEKEEEELNFYKKSYEEQKIRVNEEHKLISESLYKLAVHFMTLKDDLQNRINLAKNNK